jgi:hypothetical protein
MKSYMGNKSNLAELIDWYQIPGNKFGAGVCTSIAIMYSVTVCYVLYIVQLYIYIACLKPYRAIG